MSDGRKLKVFAYYCLWYDGAAVAGLLPSEARLPKI